MVGIAAPLLPGLAGWTAPRGPEMILDERALRNAATEVAAAALPEACGVIVSAFGDPGREALAARLDCPVIGIGEASARAVAGRAFAVVTTTPGLARAIDRMMAPVGRYLGCYLTPGNPLALMKTPALLDLLLAEAIGRAARDGAEAVIIGGGPLGEAAARLSASCETPLISPIRAAARELRARLGPNLPEAAAQAARS